jgi:serine/threonine protein phosphatase PrpC
MLDLEFAELSDDGYSRDHNEDFIGHVLPSSPAQVQTQGWLFALADGVGGQDRGEVASRLAIETILAGFRQIPKGVMHASLLPRLVQEANAAVYDAGNSGHGRGTRMGTTLVACALRFDSAVVSHVGDSRCYLFRNGTGGPITRDHTMAAEQFRLGIVSQDDAKKGENSHILTRCLGNDLFVAADTITVNIVPGDVILLCSDGLHSCVPDATILRLINANAGLDKAAAALVGAANEAGGHDNVSVQLIRVRDVERMGLYRGRPYRLL